MGCSSIKTIVRSNNNQQHNKNTHIKTNEQPMFGQNNINLEDKIIIKNNLINITQEENMNIFEQKNTKENLSNNISEVNNPKTIINSREIITNSNEIFDSNYINNNNHQININNHKNEQKEEKKVYLFSVFII